jgi:hypothetical protein
MDIPRVIPVDNPLKSVTVKKNIVSSEETILVNLPKDYINLSVGTWQVSLDYSVAVVKNHGQFDALYEIKTSLVTGIELGENKRWTSDYAVLGHLLYKPRASGSTISFDFKEYKPRFFVVDTAQADSFRVYLKRNEFLKPKSVKENDFNLELGFQFRRIQ